METYQKGTVIYLKFKSEYFVLFIVFFPILLKFIGILNFTFESQDHKS